MVDGSEDQPKWALQQALSRADPVILQELTSRFTSFDAMNELRRQLAGARIHEDSYDILLRWILHRDRSIARSAQIVVLLLGDAKLDAAIFHRLSEHPSKKPPFSVTYNSSEKEFGVELPGVPGWGVSHYGSDDPETDRLLHALEKFYSRHHPDDPVVRSFRTK